MTTTAAGNRLATGIQGLDTVLRGGFVLNSIIVLTGRPGSGKTILAEQTAFANASPERPALYLTTFSEPLEKFIANSQGFSFFDSGRIGRDIVYEDLGQVLRHRGFAALPDLIGEKLAEQHPGIVVIDSFRAIEDLARSGAEERTVLSDVASLLANYDTTAILVGEYDYEERTSSPIFAVADAILSLEKHDLAGGEQRFLRVRKFRASPSTPGLHAFRITPDGLEVFPRLLTPERTPVYAAAEERVVTGIRGLDGMLGGGLWRGSSTLVAGPTGSGKTLLALRFIHQGVVSGEPGLYVGFQENPVQLARIMRGFGWDPGALAGAGFEILYRSPVEMRLDEVGTRILERARDGRVGRVVIDALGDLRRRSLDPGRFSDYIYALTQWFAVHGVTCLMTHELPELFEFHSITSEEVSNMADNILLLRFTADPLMERSLRVIKTRGSAHDQHERVLRLSADGARIAAEGAP